MLIQFENIQNTSLYQYMESFCIFIWKSFELIEHFHRTTLKVNRKSTNSFRFVNKS